MPSGSEAQRVRLADAEPLAERLRAALGERFALVGEAAPVGALRLFGPCELEREGACALRRFRLREPQVPFVAIVPRDAPAALVRDCFRQGAADVLETGEIESELPAALERALGAAPGPREHDPDRLAEELGQRARDLEGGLARLGAAYDQTLIALVAALDRRESETACHSQRVAAYALFVGCALGLDESGLASLYRGSLLHDVGKIGIPDAILLKPGQLTQDEWRVMRRHPQFGAELLSRVDFLREASDVPAAHHENWNGRGYPRRLRGPEIPLHARIFAVVDSYDAVRSLRPYKSAQSHDEALEGVAQAAGTRLDPELAKLFASFAQPVWRRLAKLAERAPGYAELLESVRELRAA